MAEIYTTLEFKGIENDVIGKYAHPIEVKKGIYQWGSSTIPILMTIEATIADLKKLYKGLDFNLVKIVPKTLNNININNS